VYSIPKDARIFVAGHEAMIGAAILRLLQRNGFTNVIVKAASGLDLSDQRAVADFFISAKPEYVFMAAGKVGGIKANSSYPAEFIYYNLQAGCNVIHASRLAGVKKLLYLGSSCTYPKDCPQPMKEEYLLHGKLEPTSEPYAIAKIAGMTMCQAYSRQYGANYISVIPADVYGPHDDFDPETAHVFPSLLARIHAAKIDNQPEVIVWGSGSPRRELFHVDDLANACIFLMNHYNNPSVINAGFGEDISIKETALLIKEAVGYTGELTFDASKPDGMPRKLLDSSKIRSMDWIPHIDIRRGIEETYEWYIKQSANDKS